MRQPGSHSLEAKWQRGSSPALASTDLLEICKGDKKMSADKLEGIVGQISELSLLEASQLVKMMEEKFGVSAAAAAVSAAPAAAAAAPVEEEKDEFDVILSGMADPSKKIGI